MPSCLPPFCVIYWTVQEADLGKECDMEGATFHGRFVINKGTNLSNARHLGTVTFKQVEVEVKREQDEAQKGTAKPDGTDNSNCFSCCSKFCCLNDGTDRYKEIAEMPFCSSWYFRKKGLAYCVDATKMGRHKAEIEFCIKEIRNIREFPLTKENWTGFLARIDALYDYLASLVQHSGNRKLIQILSDILFSDKKVSGPDDFKWTTLRHTFLVMRLLKNGFAIAQPSPGMLHAMELGIMEPFRHPDINAQLYELRTELEHIAAITTSKAETNKTFQDIVLAALIAFFSFFASLLASYIYDNYIYDWASKIGIPVSDNDEYTPIVDSQLQQLESQQQTNKQNKQIIQLLTTVAALLNTTDAGN